MNSHRKSIDMIEKFHLLATANKIELAAQYSQDLVEWLRKFVEEQLVGTELPPIDSPEAFANAVHQLGANKKAWSNRLGSLIIERSDNRTAEEERRAIERFDEFSEQCPWKFLRESAAHRQK